MSVNIIWSYTAAGAAIEDLVDHGSVANGSGSTPKDVYIEHDGAGDITNVAIYVRQLSGTYSGTFTPSADLSKIIEWGDETVEDDFGGFMICFNKSYAGNLSSNSLVWPTYAAKDQNYCYTFRTGTGDSESNAITVPTKAGIAVAGTIGAAENAFLGFKCLVPTNESTLGVRQWETVLRYTYSS